jgi:hypothetical protein
MGQICGLTVSLIGDMVFHMAKTTLNIPDPLFRELKRRAVSRGETMSNLVAEYIRRGLEQKPGRKVLPPLPAYDGGPFLVDVSNRELVFKLLDEGRYRTRPEVREED